MKTNVQNQKIIAVLVVHGIGAQNESETLRKLMAGLQRGGCETDGGEQGECVWSGTRLRFYEVYWADLCKGEKARGAFDITQALTLAWYPLLNWLRGNYQENGVSLPRKLFWVLIMPLVHLLMMPAYLGASFFFQLYRSFRDRHRTPREQPSSEEQPGLKDRVSIWSRVKDFAERPPQSENHFDLLLDEFAGDVLTYVCSAGGAVRDTEPSDDSRATARGRGTPKDLALVHGRIMDRFHTQLLQAHRNGCHDIHVLAHSLGTVVAYHALTGLNGNPTPDDDRTEIAAAAAKVRHFHTLGSPLEKIRFFWPNLIPGAPPLGGARPLWDNYVSWFDPVAGMLGHFHGFQQVRNHRLFGGGFLRAHVVYEHSQAFLKSLAESMEVIPTLRPASSREKWKERCLLLGETLFGPLAVLAMLVAGAGFMFFLVHLLPWVFSLVARLFFEPWQWQRWVDALAQFFMWTFGIAFLFVPLSKAISDHRRFWGPDKKKRA